MRPTRTPKILTPLPASRCAGVVFQYQSHHATPVERNLVKYLSLLATVSLVVVLSACGGKQSSEPDTFVPSSTTTTSTTSTGTDDNGSYQSCVSGMTKARQCTNEYIPALVDLRISLDMPAGIAQAAQTQGREALVSRAMQEWKNDSTDASIADTCQNMAASVPDESAARISQGTSNCVAKANCSEFVSCMIPLQAEMFRMGGGRPAR